MQWLLILHDRKYQTEEQNYSRRSTERREDEELLNHSVGCMLIMALCASESADKLKDGICFSSSTKLLVKFCLMF